VLNRELAALLRTEPADLSLGAAAALGDDLVLCGILGGKDVGKSTLINALAQTRVSADAREVGRGTEHPMVYVHREQREAVQQRLQALGQDIAFDVTHHDADAIRNVALVDLPDFDSEFLEHLQVVHRVAPLLDRVLWVQTPRKIGDRALVAMFRDVVKDSTNVHCVLNKVDELLADGDLPAAKGTDRARVWWREQHTWVTNSVTDVGFAHTDDHRFLIAAAFVDADAFTRHIGQRWGDPDWSHYGDDRATVMEIATLARQDLERLRRCVLSPVSADQARTLKEANQRREQGINVTRMREHFALDQTATQLSLACEIGYHQQVLHDALGPGFAAQVAGRLAGRLRPPTALADELLERRVEAWPLLPLVYWPFGWLSRALGRRLTLGSSSPSEPVRDPFDIAGHGLEARVELVHTRLLADQSAIIRRLGIENRLPKTALLTQRATAAAQSLIPQFEARLLESIRQGDRKPGFFGKSFLWLILLWFPFLQPVLEGGLAMVAETGVWNWTQGLYRIVSAFSALHLLMGFAVVAIVYVAILAGMYARCLGTVRTALTGTDNEDPHTRLTDSVDEVLVTEILIPLVQPFQERLDRLTALIRRLETLHV
jgi:hypothetical protein